MGNLLFRYIIVGAFFLVFFNCGWLFIDKPTMFQLFILVISVLLLGMIIALSINFHGLSLNYTTEFCWCTFYVIYRACPAIHMSIKKRYSVV